MSRYISFNNIQCKALFALFQPRHARFIQDTLIFMKLSEDVKNYITQSLIDENCNEAMDIFDHYIDIHILFMHQFSYLYYGICSFQFHIDERNQDSSNHPKAFKRYNDFDESRSSFVRDNAFEGGSKYLTYASFESITILNNAKNNDFLWDIEIALYGTYTDMDDKVKELAKLFISHNLTDHHGRNWKRQIEIGPNIFSDIFHYKYNVIKSKTEVDRSVQFERTSYQCITDEMNEFNTIIQKKLFNLRQSDETLIITTNVIEAIEAEGTQATLCPSTLKIADGTTDEEDTSTVLISVESSNSVDALTNITPTVIVASAGENGEAVDAVMQNTSSFSVKYRNLSITLENNVLNMKRLLAEKFLSEFECSSDENWVQIFNNIRNKIYIETNNIMRASFLYSRAFKSSEILATCSFNKFCADQTLLNQVKNYLDPEEHKKYDQISNSQYKRVNRFILHCVATVCVNSSDINIRLKENFLIDNEIEKALTSNVHFMEILRNSTLYNVAQLANAYEIHIVMSPIRSTRKEINYEGTSSSSKRPKRRYIEVENTNKRTHSKIIRRREVESEGTDHQSNQSKKSKKSVEVLSDVDLPDNYSSAVVEHIGTEICNLCLTDVTQASSNDVMRVENKNVFPCIEWFTNLQNFCISAHAGILLNFQFVENINYGFNSAYNIGRLDIVRKEFLQIISNPNYDTSEIEKFIKSRAYFQLQLKVGFSHYFCTKDDGLCLFRSLMQLRGSAVINFKSPNREEVADWKDLDVKLDVKDNREEFVVFLKSLIEALSSLTEEKIAQGKGKELKEISIIEIQNVLDQILNCDPMYYSTFKLEGNVLCSWFILKCIPHVFSKDLIYFPGAYFMSNTEDIGKRYRQDDFEEYAFLACAMQCPSSDANYAEPMSLHLSTIETILMGNKFVFQENHFHPIISEVNYSYAIRSCVDELVIKIKEFISKGDIPKLTQQIIEEFDSEILSVAKDSLKEITEQKKHYELKLAQKDKEIAAKNEEIKNLREKMSALLTIAN